MSHQSSIFNFAYTIFLGILIASFIGFGIAAFYPAPIAPDYNEFVFSTSRPVIEPDASVSAEQEVKQKEYDSAWTQHTKDSKEYSKNVSLIALSLSVVVLVVGILFSQKLMLLADGVMFGSVLTLLYSVIRGIESEDAMFRFVVITVGLCISVVIGYLKLRKNSVK